MENQLFSKGTECFKGSYEISSIGNLRIIRAKVGSSFNFYSPIEFQGNFRNSQPKKREILEPHTHLANVNLKKEEEIINFVNKWGLLGLWKDENFKIRNPFLAPKKNLVEHPLGKPFSPYYLLSTYYPKEKFSFLEKFCEPLELFEEAASQFQELYKMLSQEKSPELIFHIVDSFKLEGAKTKPLFNNKRDRWDFGWECNCLYHWCYLLSYLDLVEGSIFKRCAFRSCSSFFSAFNPKAKYCSQTCKESAKKARQRKRS